MSVTRAAKLILTLVDHVSGPARNIRTALTGVTGAMGAVGGAVMAPARAMTAASRNFRRSASDMTMASGAMSFGIFKAGQQLFNMEDVLNEIVGRRFGKDATMRLADGFEMTKEQFRTSARDLIMAIDRESPRTAGEIARAYNQLVQAGMTHEQVEAILPTAVRFAIAGNYETEEAADKLTNVMTSMQMPMATLEQARESALRASDVIAYAANRTNSSVYQMTEAFKYAAPSAAALGVDIEQLAAMFLIQARRGIKASEAGVSIRAMFTRMIRPTQMAAAVLNNYGMDLADYMQQAEAASSVDIISALMLGGLDASAAAAEIDAIMESQLKTADKVQSITQAITRSVGDNTVLAASTISDAVREILYSSVNELDVERLIEDMQNKNIAPGDFFKIFDVRQGARTLSLFSDDLSRWVRDIRENALGFTDALSAERMEGFVGAIHRFNSAITRSIQIIGQAGVLVAVTNFVDGLTNVVDGLKDVNPHILEMGTYAAIAVASIAPLGFALTGLSAVASLLVNPITWIVGGLSYLAYLNWDGITSYVNGFGSALMNSLGPRTASHISQVSQAIQGLFTSFGGDFSGAGTAHGAAVAMWIEDVVVGIEEGVSQIRSAFGGFTSSAEFQAMSSALESFYGMWQQIGAAGIRMAEDLVRGVQAFGSAFMESLSPETVAIIEADLQRIRAAVVGVIDGYRDFTGWMGDFFASLRFDDSEFLSTLGKATAELLNFTGYLLSGRLDRDINAWIGRSFREVSTAIRNASSEIYNAGVEMIQSLWDGAAAKFWEFLDWVRSIPGQIVGAIGQINLGGLINFGGFGGAPPPPSNSGGGSGGGGGGGWGGVDGHRRNGGPVTAGGLYEINEDGTELFVPRTAGDIVSNEDLQGFGGGTVIHIGSPRVQVEINGTHDLTTADVQKAVEQAIEKMSDIIDRKLRRSARTAFTNVKYGDA